MYINLNGGLLRHFARNFDFFEQGKGWANDVTFRFFILLWWGQNPKAPNFLFFREKEYCKEI